MPSFSRVILYLAITLSASAAIAADDATAWKRRETMLHSYGTYAGDLRLPQGTFDNLRLIDELTELHANTYNWLIAHSATDWDDLQAFLPLARKQGIRVWVTLLPPSESSPRTQHVAEPFRLDYERWAGELAQLSAREPALVAWSVDDFAYNLKTFTPEYMRRVIAAQRKGNESLAFVPCVYFKQVTPSFVANYQEFLDGILFPYRSDSTMAGFADATQVGPEVKAIKERFGRDIPVVVDIYATRHSKLGASTAGYVEEVMKLAYPAADGVHIYRHQNKRNPNEREKYDVIRRVMSSWAEPPAETLK